MFIQAFISLPLTRAP